MIALLAYLVGERCVRAPSLVVVPASVRANWAIEFKQWAPKLKIIEYFGPKDERTEIFTKQVGSLKFTRDIGSADYTQTACGGEHPSSDTCSMSMA